MEKFLKVIAFYILLIGVIVLGLRLINQTPIDAKVPISTIYESVESGKIKRIEFSGRNIIAYDYSDQAVTSYLPVAMDNNFSDIISKAIDDTDIVVTGNPESSTSALWAFLPTIVLLIGFFIFMFFISKQTQGSGGKMSTFGKSKAKLNKNKEGKINFDNVAGLKEEKEELKEIVDFLKNPKKYNDLGARIPKGVLLVGPPGTGKTYISRAVAGEAGVPFFSISGSDFVEMYVGVGASRVRDLFEESKKNSPCIVFIDEIDAVGRKRGAGLGGGHDEREQTLNQLLVEMDGFSANQGVIIIAATNRPDILDPALLRPGRFDRQVYISPPDVREREDVFAVHAKNKPLDEDVDLKILAKRTPGFTPADIENLMNEAAIMTAKENRKLIDMQTIEKATTKVIAGVEKKSAVITEKEMQLTAYHEAGHAILATLLPNTDPVHLVTITPRGLAGGFTMTLPQEDVYYKTKTQMEEELVRLLGGRVAESLILDDISTGASNDLQRVAKIAREMVVKYAFSENLSAMSYGDSSDEVFLGRDFSHRRNYSEKIASQIDDEIEEIVEKAYKNAEELLSENIERLHYVAKALLKYETLTASMYKEAYEMTLDINDDLKQNEITDSANDNTKVNN